MELQLAMRVEALEVELALLKEQQRQLVKRMSMRERGNSEIRTTPQLLSYKQAGERLGGKTANAIAKMVGRKELRAIHPIGGRRAFIDSREIENYVESEGVRIIRKKGGRC